MVKVSLYIYDLSKGTARQLSLPLIGRYCFTFFSLTSCFGFQQRFNQIFKSYILICNYQVGTVRSQEEVVLFGLFWENRRIDKSLIHFTLVSARTLFRGSLKQVYCDTSFVSWHHISCNIISCIFYFREANRWCMVRIVLFKLHSPKLSSGCLHCFDFSSQFTFLLPVHVLQEFNLFHGYLH